MKNKEKEAGEAAQKQQKLSEKQNEDFFFLRFEYNSRKYRGRFSFFFFFNILLHLATEEIFLKI